MNTCSSLTVPAFPLEGQTGLTEFLFLSCVQLQLVPCIVRAGSLLFSPSACFCADIKSMMPQAGRAILCHLTHCISQDSCFLATRLWGWHSFRWRWLGSDGGTFIRKITRHNYKICIILYFWKQLEKWQSMAGGKKNSALVWKAYLQLTVHEISQEGKLQVPWGRRPNSFSGENWKAVYIPMSTTHQLLTKGL